MRAKGFGPIDFKDWDRMIVNILYNRIDAATFTGGRELIPGRFRRLWRKIMPLGKNQVMFGCMTEHFQLMPHERRLESSEKEYYVLSRGVEDESITFDSLEVMEECRALLDKVISDVRKSVGLKDTRKTRV